MTDKLVFLLLLAALIAGEFGLIILAVEGGRDVVRHRYMAAGFALTAAGLGGWILFLWHI